MNEEERRKETKDQAIPHQSDCPLPPTQTTRHKRELEKKTTTTANSSFTVDWGQLSGLKRNFSEADAPQLQISDSMWSDSPVKVQKISFQPPKRPRLLNSLNKSWFSATILRLTIVVSKSSNSATFSFFLSFFPLSCFFFTNSRTAKRLFFTSHLVLSIAVRATSSNRNLSQKWGRLLTTHQPTNFRSKAATN